ncbi:zonular occludens toxin domain-containing protein [Xanthomonas sp. XNM01]|uniref:zonular occludens toxin domain-containing protein n=1 Tax=Xanthomonas sp. XNM01 TaxID=2769289 RepID=UPI001785BFB7|nr:zonular occludens toxin domain-containing protein [Xanthomonas sp. XNM01]MBD9368379.1 zonular occludens toxin [Xanthomonas sp. XNM01]
MSAIAKTASITLITGVPGNGKTLRTVWYIKQAIEAGEEVFVCNLNGLTIDGFNDFADPTKWEELPAGAILVVDEAQRFFRAQAGNVPAYIQAMETIRHSGIRLILITQSPALIHANIRALVGLHEHLVREDGAESATVYRRNRVIDNVRSDKALVAEDHEKWAFPKDCYPLYKSAEVHTVKRTIKSKYKRAIVLFVLAAAIFGAVTWKVRDHTSADEAKAAAGAVTAIAGPVPVGGAGQPAAPRYPTLTDYAKAHVPRFGTMPWTAPVFDERAVVSQPALYCMSSGEGTRADGSRGEFSCTCLTEQGTRYELSQPECRTVARHGMPYNAYQQPMMPIASASPGLEVIPPPDQSGGSVVARQNRAQGTFPEVASSTTRVGAL